MPRLGYNLVRPCTLRGMGEKIVNVRIRFPESLKDRVQSFADTDRRSLNSEVLTLLEEAMNARQSTGSRTLRCADPPAPYDTSPPSPAE